MHHSERERCPQSVKQNWLIKAPTKPTSHESVGVPGIPLGISSLGKDSWCLGLWFQFSVVIASEGSDERMQRPVV